MQILANGDGVHVWMIRSLSCFDEDLLQFVVIHEPTSEARDDGGRGDGRASEQPKLINGGWRNLHVWMQPAFRLWIGWQLTHKPSLQLRQSSALPLW